MDSTNILALCLLVFIKSSQSELVYDWNKIDVDPLPIQNWRPTSFTVAKDQIFLTLVDVNRNSPGNGLLATFNKSESVYALFASLSMPVPIIITITTRTS